MTAALDVFALEFVAVSHEDSYQLIETTTGPPLGVDMRVLINPRLDVMRGAAILEEVARRLRNRGSATEPPTIGEVGNMLRRLGRAAGSSTGARE